jgi:DNA-binding PadR family transcriptional regulator
VSYSQGVTVSEPSTFVRSLWALTVLSFLRERPLHPYEIWQMVVERHKNQFLDLKRGSLYHAVEQLQRVKLIEAVETFQQGRRPERTIYRLTILGERELLAWLADILQTPTNQREFFAALSFLAHIPPKDVANLLEHRAEQLRRRIGDIDQSLATLTPKIGRVLLLESEFVCAADRAELAWVRSLIEEIRSGAINWKPGQSFSEQSGSPPHPQDQV